MDLRDRAIVLLMSSSGPRIGAIPGVRMKDLEPVDSYNIFKITYYPKSKKSRYFSFCTPESRKAIDDYVDLEALKDKGRKITHYEEHIPSEKDESTTTN